MRYCADSSFLVSCFLADRNTAAANAWISGVGASLPFTSLHELEVRNAFRLGMFRGLITPADAMRAQADLQSDFRSGRLIRTTINWPRAFRMATAVSARHTAATGGRSLDILHVAAAKSLRARELVSFDTRQRLLASAVGLSIVP